MCGNLIIPMLFLIFTAGSASAETLIAPVYPGAVSCGPGASHPGCYLSRDSFDQVKAFYEADRGSAADTEGDTERERYAFFEYMSAAEVDKYDPPGAAIGVSIYTNTLKGDKTTWVVDEILDKFKMLVAQNYLTQEDYNSLADKYAHLAIRHYPPSEELNSDGKPLPMDQVIGSRCEKEQRPGKSSAGRGNDGCESAGTDDAGPAARGPGVTAGDGSGKRGCHCPFTQPGGDKKMGSVSR